MGSIVHSFESFVNSERCKTSKPTQREYCRLRALLIQKDVKRNHIVCNVVKSLRALLIQKDVKLFKKKRSQ